jgi:hypothetical protein
MTDYTKLDNEQLLAQLAEKQRHAKQIAKEKSAITAEIANRFALKPGKASGKFDAGAFRFTLKASNEYSIPKEAALISLQAASSGISKLYPSFVDAMNEIFNVTYTPKSGWYENVAAVSREFADALTQVVVSKTRISVEIDETPNAK